MLRPNGEKMESLLPKNLQDKSFLALEECVKTSLDIDIKKIMTSIVDYLPENILSVLAEQFSIKDEGYSDCVNRDEKIALIKNAVSLHKRKGSIGAIADILQLYSGEAEYIPWYKYNGISHHFMIDKFYYDTGVDILSDYRKIKTNLENTKQLRAKLDGINFYTGIKKDNYISSAIIAGEILTVDFGGV